MMRPMGPFWGCLLVVGLLWMPGEGRGAVSVYVGAAVGILMVVMGVLVWRWRRKR